jgi:hypothetical protein
VHLKSKIFLCSQAEASLNHLCESYILKSCTRQFIVYATHCYARLFIINREIRAEAPFKNACVETPLFAPTRHRAGLHLP